MGSLNGVIALELTSSPSLKHAVSKKEFALRHFSGDWLVESETLKAEILSWDDPVPCDGVGFCGIVSVWNSRQSADMLATVVIPVPNSLLLHSKDLASLQLRSRFLLAMKFFELAELSSGQAAERCGVPSGLLRK